MKGATLVMSMLVVVAMTLFIAKPGNAGITCGQVDSYLAACIPYLTTGAGNPAPKCCEGIGNLKTNTPTVEDRRAACACVKAAADHYTVKEDAASSLPGKCNVVIGIPISKTTNCQTIN